MVDLNPVDGMDWLGSVNQKLISQYQQGLMPHALLFQGNRGYGTVELALNIATTMLCQNPKRNSACGECKTCQLMKAASHPDLKILQPEESGGQLKVDQIRSVIEFAAKTSQQGGSKVILIEPADQMNLNSANALLKVLEEPPSGTFIFLVTERIESMLPTIRSRCSIVKVTKPTLEQAKVWLTNREIEVDKINQFLPLCNYAPITLLNWQQGNMIELHGQMITDLSNLFKGVVSPIEVAASWQKKDLLQIFHWLGQWFTDLSRACGAGLDELISDQAAKKLLKYTASKADTVSIFELTDYILSIRSGLLNRNNLNAQLVLENTLIRWNKLISY